MKTSKSQDNQDNDFFRGMLNALPLAVGLWVGIILVWIFYGDIISWLSL